MDVQQRSLKRPRIEEKACIICSHHSPISDLIRPKDKQSIITLQKAAEIRMFLPILNLVESEYEEKLYYHRNCRSSFTHKKTLEGSLVRNEESTSGTETRKSTRETSTTNTSRVFEHICIFCMKKNKYSQGSKSTELLIQSRELRSDEKIRNAAIANMDHKIIAITSRELVAAEAHYHKSCYRNYTRGEKQKSTVEPSSDDDIRYQTDEQNAYHLLCDHIRSTLFSEPQTMRLTTLTDRLAEFMGTLGYTSDQVKQQTKNHIITT